MSITSEAGRKRPTYGYLNTPNAVGGSFRARLRLVPVSKRQRAR